MVVARADAPLVLMVFNAPRIGAASVCQRKGLPGNFFDRAQQGPFAMIAQGNGAPGRARARRASDSMHIGLGRIGQFVIYDMGHIVDIDPARRNIGRNEDRVRPLRKLSSARNRWL